MAGPVDPNGLGAAASRLSQGARRSAHAALLVTGALLDDGERVECLVAGRFEGESAVATLTNQRLLIVNERGWRPSVVSQPVDAALAVQGWQDSRTATLNFVADGRQLLVDHIGDRQLAIEMAGRIRARLAAG